MPKPLAPRLVANGCDIPLSSFATSLKKTLERDYPTWTIDELLLHPDEAKHYCDIVRREYNVHGLPDDLILRCHLTKRKNP